jgi:thiamine kinase-like enzyme
MRKIDVEVLWQLINRKKDFLEELSNSSVQSQKNILKSIKYLTIEKILDQNFDLSTQYKEELRYYCVKQAVIVVDNRNVYFLQDGGLRKSDVPYYPENTLKCIKRLIAQLNQKGITDVTLLISGSNIQAKLLEQEVSNIENNCPNIIDLSQKDHLCLFDLESKYLENAYIINANLWAEENPFRKYELYSWKNNWSFQKDVISQCQFENSLFSETAIQYIDHKESTTFSGIYEQECSIDLNRNNKLSKHCFDLECDEDEQADLPLEAFVYICRNLHIEPDKIHNITTMKKGMTNDSFCFTVNQKKYIIRIPGKGTTKIIDRKEEAEVYKIINARHISEPLVSINPENGYKISEFLENIHVCDADDEKQVKRCMDLLKKFHKLHLNIPNTFDLRKQIYLYESLRMPKNSQYSDYEQTKAHILELLNFIDHQPKDWTLCHIDAIPDNFLIGGERVYLIDWEYAGMQDSMVDLAMFAIYAGYDQKQIEELLSLYYEEEVDTSKKAKMFAYVAICGFLWSNWCEYKHSLGVEFGEYSLRQYHYAKEYYVLAKEQIKAMEESECISFKEQ